MEPLSSVGDGDHNAGSRWQHFRVSYTSMGDCGLFSRTRMFIASLFGGKTLETKLMADSKVMVGWLMCEGNFHMYLVTLYGDATHRSTHPERDPTTDQNIYPSKVQLGEP